MEILDRGFEKKLDRNSPMVAILKRNVAKCKSQILNGKIAAYILIVLHVASSFFAFFQDNAEMLSIAIELVFFLILYLIGIKKLEDDPKPGFIILISVMLFFLSLKMILLGFTSILRGFIFNGAILFFLINGLNGAIRFKELNGQLKKYGEEVLL